MTPRRLVAHALVAASMATAVGCGTDQAANVASVADRWMQAIRSANGRVACALMTTAAQASAARFARWLALTFEAGPPRSCEGGYEQPTRAWTAKATADVQGNRAVATFAGTEGNTKPLRVPLVRQHGKWLIDHRVRGVGGSLDLASRRCVDDWNSAVADGSVYPLPTDSGAQPNHLWATISEPTPGIDYCGLSVSVPNALLAYNNEGGSWRYLESGPRVAGTRNVWMDAQDKLSPLTEGVSNKPPATTTTPSPSQTPSSGGTCTEPDCATPLQPCGGGLSVSSMTCAQARGLIASFPKRHAPPFSLPGDWYCTATAGGPLTCSGGVGSFRLNRVP